MALWDNVFGLRQMRRFLAFLQLSSICPWPVWSDGERREKTSSEMLSVSIQHDVTRGWAIRETQVCRIGEKCGIEFLTESVSKIKDRWRCGGREKSRSKNKRPGSCKNLSSWLKYSAKMRLENGTELWGEGPTVNPITTIRWEKENIGAERREEGENKIESISKATR